jgi:hypothetical protein
MKPELKKQKKPTQSNITIIEHQRQNGVADWRDITKQSKQSSP